MFPNRKNNGNKDINISSYRPPYELSKELIKSIKEGRILLNSQLLVVDVGAARALDPRWEVFGNKCMQIGFEPDPKECKFLQNKYKQDPESTLKLFEDKALWSKTEKLKLNITKDPDATSFLVPNKDFFNRLPDPSIHDVIDYMEIITTTLDEYAYNTNTDIDFIKLDIQGAELEVMKGAQAQLKNGLLGVIAELMFTPQYLDQPWFGDFDSFMRANGYQVIDIDFRRWRKTKLPSQFDGIRIGGIAYGDVLYFKDPISIELNNLKRSGEKLQFCTPGKEKHKLIKLIALCEFFAVPDYAIELCMWGCNKKYFNIDEKNLIIDKINNNTILSVKDRNVMPTEYPSNI